MHSFSRSSSQVGCTPPKRRERAMGHRKEEIQLAQMRRFTEHGEEDPRRRAVFAQRPWRAAACLVVRLSSRLVLTTCCWKASCTAAETCEDISPHRTSVHADSWEPAISPRFTSRKDLGSRAWLVLRSRPEPHRPQALWQALALQPAPGRVEVEARRSLGHSVHCCFSCEPSTKRGIIARFLHG